jgi:phospholipid/cholesterol/gamma-HCH transport system permease protein
MSRSAAPRRKRQEPPSVRLAGNVGRSAIDNLHTWRELFVTLSSAVMSLFAPGRAARDTVREIAIKQVFFTGVQGLPFVTATALIIGATMMLQTQVATPGLPGEVMGKIITGVVLREMAPLVTAIIITSRSGTAIATELGNMKANLEVHALLSMGIDPVRYVVQPRMIGVIVAVMVLTVYFTMLAVIGSFAAVVRPASVKTPRTSAWQASTSVVESASPPK